KCLQTVSKPVHGSLAGSDFPWWGARRGFKGRSISSHGPGGEIGEVGGAFGRTAVVLLFPQMRRGEAKSHGHHELLEGPHLVVEPSLRPRAEGVRPTDSRPQMLNSEALQPIDCRVQSRIFEVKPLTNPQTGRKVLGREFRAAVLFQ